jgi:hypothetical protein
VNRRHRWLVLARREPNLSKGIGGRKASVVVSSRDGLLTKIRAADLEATAATIRRDRVLRTISVSM